MDTGLGKLTPISEEKAIELEGKEVDGVFRLGEIFILKGVKFKVQNIKPKKLTLKVLRNN